MTGGEPAPRRMDGPRWDRLATLFGAAREHPAAARPAFVHGECADDAALRDELLAMLAAHDDERGLAIERRLVADGGAPADHRRALAIARRAHGPRHLATTDAMYDLAQVLRDEGDHDGAERLNRESLAIVRAELGPDHALVAVYLTNLAATLEARGNCAAAVPVLREAIAGMRRTISADRHRIPLAQRRLGSCLARAGRYAEAESLLVESRAVLAQVLAPDDRRIRDVEARLAEVRRTRTQ